MYFKTSYQSPIGRLTLASDGEALIGLWLENQKYFAATVREEMADEHDLPVLAAAQDWLDRYFAGEKPAHRPFAHWLPAAGLSDRRYGKFFAGFRMEQPFPTGELPKE